MTYILPKDVLGYTAGTELRDVTLAEARAMECSRCGDCCDGSREGVKKDEPTGLPLFVWESRDRAADPTRSQTADPERYAPRFDGKPLLLPIIMVDGSIGIGKAFDLDADGKPHTSFRCRALMEYPEGPDGPEAGCAIYHVPETAHESVQGVRPLNCADFPVFGQVVDESIISHGYYVPPTGALPRCVWYGIRVTGPWKDTPEWVSRFEEQQRGRVQGND